MSCGGSNVVEDRTLVLVQLVVQRLVQVQWVEQQLEDQDWEQQRLVVN